MIWRCPACAAQNDTDEISECRFCGSRIGVTKTNKLITEYIHYDTPLCAECRYMKKGFEDGYYTCYLDNSYAKERLKRIACDKAARKDSSFYIYRFLYAANIKSRTLRILCSNSTQYNIIIHKLIDDFKANGITYDFSDLVYPLGNADSWLTEENVWGAVVLNINEDSNSITLTGEFDLPYSAEGILYDEIIDNNLVTKIVKCIVNEIKGQCNHIADKGGC